jgi:hypothetical protein
MILTALQCFLHDFVPFRSSQQGWLSEAKISREGWLIPLRNTLPTSMVMRRQSPATRKLSVQRRLTRQQREVTQRRTSQCRFATYAIPMNRRNSLPSPQVWPPTRAIRSGCGGATSIEDRSVHCSHRRAPLSLLLHRPCQYRSVLPALGKKDGGLTGVPGR